MLLEEVEYAPTDEIILETMEKEYYVLNAKGKNGDLEDSSFKFYVLLS